MPNGESTTLPWRPKLCILYPLNSLTRLLTRSHSPSLASSPQQLCTPQITYVRLKSTHLASRPHTATFRIRRTTPNIDPLNRTPPTHSSTSKCQTTVAKKPTEAVTARAARAATALPAATRGTARGLRSGATSAKADAEATEGATSAIATSAGRTSGVAGSRPRGHAEVVLAGRAATSSPCALRAPSRRPTSR